MKRIEVRLSVDVVAPLLDVVRDVSDGLKDRLAAPLRLTDLDEEMHEAWREDLQASQNVDVATLLGLFSEEFFRDGTIVLDEENAESVLRGCAAVRLRLRSHELSEISEELLESSNVAMEDLPEPQRRPFMCYLFLATLQELIIQHLYPPEIET